ncbi:T9SS type A sorting domain-containing protein [Flavobacterium piscinae]|uniref:T9SS type A sorting domain-containing protein n=1 Tax=Flavobacterium piscinae TaxID=2506424 RepID=UPI00198C3243|nr:T9SS type A sorting domain-containing protein [Flavobacterium piscinae]
MFPNPVVDFLSISNSSEINEIEIISALGQRIILLKINQQQTTLDLSILTSGIYFLKLISVEDYETIKIIKR